MKTTTHFVMIVILTGLSGLIAAAPATGAEQTKSNKAAAGDVAALTEAIDRRIAKRWATQKITPAKEATDAEFLRRVYLDIVGKIPSTFEVRFFLADQSPNKRRQLVDRLLASPAYASHFTAVWRSVMIPEADSDPQVRYLATSFETWLHNKLAAGVGYDVIVREILTTPLSQPRRNPRFAGRDVTSPIAFYQAKQVKPENLAASTAQIFLGIQIQCAQCHDHPFDQWKREQFWGYAAFFAGLHRDEKNGRPGAIREVFDRRELAIPDTQKVVQAAFLDGRQPRWEFRVGSRVTLANWLTAAENPYFARATANRIWALFLGRGLVHPVDVFQADNPPSHPALLDELARQFADHQFDVKFLIRAITASRAYQLTSSKSHASQTNPADFARMTIRMLTSEQLVGSLSQATGLRQRGGINSRLRYSRNSPLGELASMFSQASGSESPQQMSVLQALAMMNGRLVADVTSLEKSATLAAISNYPGMTATQKVETLFLTTLSRRPREAELKRLARYVERGGPGKDPDKALGDVFWALLNSSEFIFNH